MKFVDDAFIDEGSFEINVTPLIDIVFLLLIFFMVTTTFVDSQGIQVQLPQASTEPAKESSPVLSVSVSTKGEIFIGNDKMSLDTLRKRLQTHSQKPDSTLVVRADTDATHGAVVQIMDIAKQSGVNRIAIATEPASP